MYFISEYAKQGNLVATSCIRECVYRGSVVRGEELVDIALNDACLSRAQVSNH